MALGMCGNSNINGRLIYAKKEHPSCKIGYKSSMWNVNYFKIRQKPVLLADGTKIVNVLKKYYGE